MKVTFNGIAQLYEGLEDFASALGRFDLERQFELWISAPTGQSISMLRNGDNAWLMYLCFDGDSGSVTQGTRHDNGTCEYKLSNGQVDEYPFSWCIQIEQCYKAIAHFYLNNGARYNLVTWQDT